MNSVGYRSPFTLISIDNNMLIITLSLLAFVFFTGMEIAIVSSGKPRLGLNKSGNSFNDRISGNTIPFLATTLIGNIISLVIFSMAFAWFFNESYPQHSNVNPAFAIITASVISMLILLITAELFSKTIFSLNPNRTLKIFSVPLSVMYFLFYPLIKGSISLTGYFSKLWFRTDLNLRQKQMVFGKTDLNNFISEVEKVGETQHEIENEIKLFKNALDFSKVRVRDCMVQRPDMELVENSAEIDQLRNKFIETGFSKILVYRNQIDNIIGYVHSFDLFNQPENIESCLREVSFIPETMEAKKLLTKLLKEHKSIAIVVDEFGGTAGMITTEDILEEIFGDIEDEHDKPGIVSKKINDKHYIFSGRLEIETINDIYNLNLQTDSSYETIAGYILYHHPSFPKTNSTLKIGNYNFKILRSSKTSIELVEMKQVEN